MGWMRAVIGAVIGIMIMRLEGWPIYLIIEIFNLSSEMNLILLYLVVGILVGILSGSTIWGIISCIILMPSMVLLYSFVTRSGSIFYYIQRTFQTMPLLYLGIGGLIGGAISGSLLGEDYVILKIKK